MPILRFVGFVADIFILGIYFQCMGLWSLISNVASKLEVWPMTLCCQFVWLNPLIWNVAFARSLLWTYIFIIILHNHLCLLFLVINLDIIEWNIITQIWIVIFEWLFLLTLHFTNFRQFKLRFPHLFLITVIIKLHLTIFNPSVYWFLSLLNITHRWLWW